jgi:hypothetical protein
MGILLAKEVPDNKCREQFTGKSFALFRVELTIEK